ncbi:putative hhf2p protein, partial [Zalerion maritima]
KILCESIQGITKPTIRRLARRGGVKRISNLIYEDIRAVLKARIETIIRDCVIYVEHRQAKTVTVDDVIFALRRLGKPLYGFDDGAWPEKKKRQIGGRLPPGTIYNDDSD